MGPLAACAVALMLSRPLAAQDATLDVVRQASGTTQLLVAVHPVNDRIVWASGAGGTVLRTTDGGDHWRAMVVPGAEGLQFRDVHALDSLSAWILSIGNADTSRIYHTTDGGAHWTLQFTNREPAAFYDCFAFWDAKRAIAMSDGVRGRTPVRLTSNGGAEWTLIPEADRPVADSGEGSLAASGTCVAVAGTRHAWIGTVGNALGGRVLRSTDGGKHWQASTTPIGGGVKGSSVASLAFRDTLNGFAGGAKSPRVARTRDGGVTWTAVGEPAMAADVYGLAWRGALIAVGPTGASVSTDEGEHWQPVDGGNWWSVAFASETTAFMVGPKGQLARVRVPRTR